MPIRARILLGILVLILLAGGAWFYLHRDASAPTDTLTLYGNIDIREVRPTFNASGRITSMLVEEGATVKKGQTLATLDDTRYKAALTRAKAEAAAAKVTLENNEVILGIVYNPFTNEFFQTERGTKSYIGMLTLPLRQNPEVAVVNFKPEREHPIVGSLNTLFKEKKIKKLTSIGGSITYSMCMVAKGAYSNYIAFFEKHASPWDLSAAYIIIKNAGGFVTDLEGKEIDPINHRGYIVASANEAVRDQFLGLINPLLQK